MDIGVKVRYMNLRLNFSWIEENVIAGAHYPDDSSDFDYLRNNGIKVIISLRQKNHYTVLPAKVLKGFVIYHLPIEDFSIPTDEQVREFWQLYQKHEKLRESIVVHCYAGCGRTGTMLAAWLLLKEKVKTGQEAIEMVRELRPCSIESDEQEEFICHVGRNLHLY